MKLKDMWKDIIDGESEIVGENINNIAHTAIKNEEKIDELDTNLSEKQNISNNLTIVPDNYGATSISLDGKAQYYYLESVNPDGNSLNLDIFCDGFEKDEFTFYLYLKLLSENPMSFSINIINPSEGVMSVKWLEEPTIDYPHTKMLLVFQTTDGGASWIANQCYSLEVTE